MKRIIFLFFVVLILFFDSNVYAICDTTHISRLKGIASNVQFTYEHNVYGSLDDEDGILSSVYNIIVTGLTEEIYVMDDSGNNYYYSDLNQDGVLNINTSSGKRNFYIFSKTCARTLLYTKVLDLPTFNFNSLSDECQKEEFKELDICVEFLDDEEENISSEEFEQVIEQVNNERRGVLSKVVNFVKNNLLYVGIGLGVIVLISVLLLVRYRKRSVLE